jgi:hypothetical protein
MVCGGLRYMPCNNRNYCITITILYIIHGPVFYLKKHFGDWILSPYLCGKFASSKRQDDNIQNSYSYFNVPCRKPTEKVVLNMIKYI